MKTLSNRNSIASRHINREKASVPVDVRRIYSLCADVESIVPEKSSRSNLSKTGEVKIVLKRKKAVTKQNHQEIKETRSILVTRFE